MIFPAVMSPRPPPYPMERPPRGQGRAGASPQLHCHPARQQGAVPGACFPGTADGVGEAAGPARPRTSAPTLSISDSQSCQGLTGLMIVGAAGQEPPGMGQAWTPASCPPQPGTGLCGCHWLHPQPEGSPGPAGTGRPQLWHFPGIHLHQFVIWQRLGDAPAVAGMSPGCP